MLPFLAESSSSTTPYLFGVPITGAVIYGAYRVLHALGTEATTAAQQFMASRADKVPTTFTTSPAASAALATLRNEPAPVAAPPPTPEPYAFVSYHHRDRAYVDRLAATLRQKGVATWYDTQLAPGSAWRREIGNRIEDAAAFVVVMSGADPSDEVAIEIDWARHNKKDLFPISVGGASYFGVNHLQRANVTGATMPNAAFLDALAQRVRRG